MSTELSRPFVGAEMKKLDVAFITFFTVIGLLLTGYEAYEIANQDPCTEVRAIAVFLVHTIAIDVVDTNNFLSLQNVHGMRVVPSK